MSLILLAAILKNMQEAIQLDIMDPTGDRAIACLRRYYGELAGRFEFGYDPDGDLAFSSEDLAPPRGYFLVAVLDGEDAGCGGIKFFDNFAEVKRMWVDPERRGEGLGRRILEELENVAAEAGYSRIRLDTHDSLDEAKGLYLRAGYREIPRYNENPYAQRWFEKKLEGAAG